MAKRTVLSLRLPEEELRLLRELTGKHAARYGDGVRPSTATDVLRWALRLAAKELSVEVPAPSIPPVPNGAQEPAHAPEPGPPSEPEDPVAAIVEAATTSHEQEESTLTAPPVDKPVEAPVKEPLPDELEEMLKGV